MNFEIYNFRNALAILESRPEWGELKGVIGNITRQDIIDTQTRLAQNQRSAPAGAQQAMNAIFKDRLPQPEWVHERALFEGGDDQTDQELAKWAMDFVKRGQPPEGGREPDFGMGVEVSFNHAAAIAWTLVRLDLASESSEVHPDARIDVGVAIYASKSLKSWGKMDGAVGTYEQACQWLEVMRPVIPLPLALVGLFPGDSSGDVWADPGVFRGTRRRR